MRNTNNIDKIKLLSNNTLDYHMKMFNEVRYNEALEDMIKPNLLYSESSNSFMNYGNKLNNPSVKASSKTSSAVLILTTT